MDTRGLNTMHHTKGSITKSQFLNFEKLRASGKTNMFGVDPDIQREDNYERCHQWFIKKCLDSDLMISLSTGLVQFHLIEREDGTVYDPMTGFNQDLEVLA